MVVTACGSTTGTSPSASAGETPVNGGTMNVGVWQPQASFLNAGITDSQTYSYVIDAPSTEGLLWYRAQSETADAKSQADYWQPWLASEVPTTQNGDVKTSGCEVAAAKMCVTWKLRSDVKWHDGSTFSATDVCDTFNFWFIKYQNNNPTHIATTSGWDQVTGCSIKDPHTAVVSYSSTYGAYLALGSGVYGVLPASLLDKAFAANASISDFKFTGVDLGAGSGNTGAYKTPSAGASMDLFLDGTGPYVLASFDPSDGGGVTYVANKNYWNKAHQPHLDKLHFKFEADTAATINDITAHNIDLAFDTRLGSIKGLLDLKSKGKLQVQTIPDSGAEKLDLNVCDDHNFWVGGKSLCGADYKHSPYLANKDVRHAILMAIDRANIVTKITGGQGQVPKDSYMYLGAEYIDSADLPATKHDVDAANNLLNKDNFPYSAQCDGGKYRAFSDGTCMSLTISTTKTNAGRVDAESLIEADLLKIGIKVIEPFSNPTNSLFDNYSDGGVLYTHKFDMAIFTSTMSAPAEPDAFYSAYVGCYPADGSTPTTTTQCVGSSINQIASSFNPLETGNDTGINIPELNQAMTAARNSVDLTVRAENYIKAEKILAEQLPEIGLFRQVTVDSFGINVRGVEPNDIVWSFNTYDWWCAAGKCQQT